MAHAGGRPTEYNSGIIDKVKEYLASCGDLVYEVKTRPLIKDGVHVGEEEYTHKKTKLPTIEGLGLYLGLSKDTIYSWEGQEGKEEFSDVIDRLRRMQADMLVNNGLTGDYSPVIAKVLLTKHGYRDAVDTDITSKGEKVESSLATAKLAQEYEDKLKANLK